MCDVRHTRLSRDRKSFIERSLSQTSGPECNHQSTPMQKCSRKIDQLRQHIFRAEVELQKINDEIDDLLCKTPIMIKNMKISNEKEYQTQIESLKVVQENFEKSLTDFHSLSLKEKNLIREVETLTHQNDIISEETEMRNYNIFKKGQFLENLENDEREELQEPCHLNEIEKIWTDILNAEKELFKWQNFDSKQQPNQRQTKMNEDDINEYLISFIKDALCHFILDGGSPCQKQQQLDLLISLFEFNDQELAVIKKSRGSTNRTQSMSW